MKKTVITFGVVTLSVFAYILLSVIRVGGQSNLLDGDDFLLIAHRGASAEAPEHTMEAYRLAKAMKADYIEIDLQMTLDGTLVALHDETVDRTTDGTGKVIDMDLSEIKKLDAGTWYNRENPNKAKSEYIGAEIPTLQEVFEEFGDDVNYYIETKQPDKRNDMEEKLLDLLEKYDLLDGSVEKGQVIIQSFSLKSLEAIHGENSKIPLIKLMSNNEIENTSEADIDLLKEYVVGVGFNYKAADKDYIKTLRKEGLLIHPFTLDEPGEVIRLKSWGSTGIFTNDINAVIGSLE